MDVIINSLTFSFPFLTLAMKLTEGWIEALTYYWLSCQSEW